MMPKGRDVIASPREAVHIQGQSCCFDLRAVFQTWSHAAGASWLRINHRKTSTTPDS